MTSLRDESFAAPHQFPQHAARIEKADLSYPIELFKNNGRWVILDGYHRLAAQALANTSSINVRFHPDEYLQLVVA